jgi:acyl carrier protein
MDSVHRRLTTCFRAVLPRYSGDIAQANPAEDKDWDSLTTVTLLSLIQEEFNIQIPTDALEQFGSFQTAESYLRRRLSDSSTATCD